MKIETGARAFCCLLSSHHQSYHPVAIPAGIGSGWRERVSTIETPVTGQTEVALPDWHPDA
jgi:hypothetical protein